MEDRTTTLTLTLRRRHRVMLTIAIAAGLASVTALGVYGFFSATTENSGNELTSGTVTFSDNDAGSALYSVTAMRPGDTVSRCIKITYTGSLPAQARLYASGVPGTLAQYTDLVITQGTQSAPSFPGCTAFTPDAAGTIFSGTLQSFEQTRTGYANGVATTPPGVSAWNTNGAAVYRFQATLQPTAPDGAQGASTGVHSFVWEARSQ